MSAVETFRFPAASRPGIFSRLGTALSRWAEMRETRNQLNRLSDRELSDIGLSRGDIDRIARGL